MPTIQIEADVSEEELLQAVSQLTLPELEKFIPRVLALHAQRKAPVLPSEEASLLLKINEPVPVAIRKRYDKLIAKRRAETLSPEEYHELLTLTEEVENFDARRVGYMADLARRRGISLTQLMQDLDIHPPPYA